MTKVISILAMSALALASANAASIFSTDFEGGALPAEMIGGAGSVVSSVSVNGNVADGNFVLQNSTGGSPIGTPGSPTTISLTGLAANQALTLDFTFLAIATWDGTTYMPGTYSPDYLNVDLNSNSIFQGSFRNFSDAGNPEYPGCTVGVNCTSANYPDPPSGTTVTIQQSAAGDSGTSIYDITIANLTADGSGNALFSFYASGIGWQGSSDESIGLDNISVTSVDTADAPEPATYLMFACGLGALAFLRRRSSSVQA